MKKLWMRRAFSIVVGKVDELLRNHAIQRVPRLAPNLQYRADARNAQHTHTSIPLENIIREVGTAKLDMKIMRYVFRG